MEGFGALELAGLVTAAITAAGGAAAVIVRAVRKNANGATREVARPPPPAQRQPAQSNPGAFFDDVPSTGNRMRPVEPMPHVDFAPLDKAVATLNDMVDSGPFCTQKNLDDFSKTVDKRIGKLEGKVEDQGKETRKSILKLSTDLGFVQGVQDVQGQQSRS